MNITLVFGTIAALSVFLLIFFVIRMRSKSNITVTEQQIRNENERLFEDARFRNIATEVLSAATKTLVEVARGSLHQETELQKKEVELLIKPLAETVKSFKKDLDEVEAKRNKEYGSLDQLVKSLVESQGQLKSETSNLVNALKRPTVRGRWGEVQLRRIVEFAGLSNQCDFVEQLSVDTEEGKLRPDLTVNLPAGRQIIVDAKAVLNGYLEAEEAKDEISRKAALVRHASALRTRITDLSRKAYWEQFKITPEFVVLFIPGEAFFSAALEEDPGLVEYGFEQRVILATPTTLMALLKAVAYGWRQEQLAENARKIADHASRLYQGLSVWAGHLSSVGSSLDRASKAYNSAVGSLERSVMVPARKLKEMGVSSKDEIADLPLIETALRSFELNGPGDEPSV